MRSRRIRILWLPPWRRAPLRGWRSPSLFLGVAAAAFVLGLAGGSRAMFASSTARASLAHDVEEGCRFDVGLRVERTVAVAGGEAFGPLAPLDDAGRALDDAVAPVEGIDPAVVTLIADGGQVSAGGAQAVVQLIERTGALRHIEVLDEAPGPGAWLPDVLADDLGVAAGDTVDVAATGTPVAVPVAGVYRDLRPGRDRSWCSMRFFFEARTAGGSAPPPVVLFDEGTLVPVLSDAGDRTAGVWWEYAPDPATWDLPTARDATAALKRTADAVNNQSDPLGELLGYGGSSVDVPLSVRKAERTAASVESVAGPVALGTMGVAVVMLLVAARSWLARRAQEVTMLTLRGAGPAALGLKGMGELFPALLLGAAGGIVAAIVTVRQVGPDPRIEGSAVVEGVAVVGVALAVALAALAAVVAAGVRRVGVGAGGAKDRRALPPWEPAVLAVAGAAFYELQVRDTVVDDTQVDGLLLLFPLLLLAGGAGLAGRLLLSPRPANWLAGRAPASAWLALRRLIAARTGAALIVTGVAVSIGIVVFAGTMSASVQATSYAKAALGPGSAQVVRLSRTSAPPETAPLPGISTLVTRTSEEGVLRRGHTTSDVLGVDPATFADAAFWDGSFAGRSLDGLLDLLDAPGGDGGAAPAIGVGPGLPDELVLSLPDAELPVRIVGRAEAFPGLGSEADRPLVVVDRDRLTRLGVTSFAEVWIDDPSPAVPARLEEQGLSIVYSTRPGEDVAGSELQPHVWAIDYLEVVGLAAGLVTVAGLGLYFAADTDRRRLSTAVARQLGMRARQGAAATACEVAAILFAGLALGVGLAWLAARLVFGNLDPLPHSPPAALLRLDLGTVAVCGAAAAVVAVLMTMLVEWRLARNTLPEVLRDVG